MSQPEIEAIFAILFTLLFNWLIRTEKIKKLYQFFGVITIPVIIYIGVNDWLLDRELQEYKGVFTLILLSDYLIYLLNRSFYWETGQTRWTLLEKIGMAISSTVFCVSLYKATYQLLGGNGTSLSSFVVYMLITGASAVILVKRYGNHLVI